MIDDAQWLDAASVRALGYLAHTQRFSNLGIILTVRDRERRPDFDQVLATIVREDFSVHLPLEPLDGPSASALLRQVAGNTVSAADAFALMQRIGGNPLLLTEYARLPADDRRNGEIPLAARALLERRLHRFPDDVLRVLGAAGVIGETFELDLLAAVSGLDLFDLIDRLDAAVAESIIDPDVTGAGYRFRHGLIRDAVIAQLTVLRRQTLHARVAQALETRGEDSRTLIRRAQHLSAATPIVGPGPVVEACLRAARVAESLWDWDLAAQQWESALRAAALVPDGDPTARDELLVARLAALARGGRAQTVLDTVDAALDSAASRGLTATIGRLAAVLLRTAGAWPWSAYGADPSALLARLAALDNVVAHDPATHAQVLAALAVGNCYHPDPQVPDAQSRRAIDIADQLGDPEVLADALIARALTFSGIAGRAEETIGLLDRLAALPGVLEAIPGVRHGTDDVLRHALLTMADFSRGDMDAVAEHLRAGIAGSDRLRLPVTRVQLRWVESRTAQWRGDLDRSAELAAMAYERHQQTELYSADITYRTVRMALRWERGELAGTAIDEAMREPTVWHALAAAEIGDRERGREAIALWLRTPRPDHWYSLADRTWLGHAVADLELAEFAPDLIRLLIPDRAAIAAVGQTVNVGPVAVPLGKLHALLGDVDAARDDLNLAVRLAHQGGGRTDLLRARLAQLKLDATGPLRSDGLAALAAEAEQLGMKAVARAARRAAGT